MTEKNRNDRILELRPGFEKKLTQSTDDGPLKEYPIELIDAVREILLEFFKSIRKQNPSKKFGSTKIRNMIMADLDKRHPDGFDPRLTRYNVEDYFDKSVKPNPNAFYCFNRFVDHPDNFDEIAKIKRLIRSRISKLHKKVLSDIYHVGPIEGVEFFECIKKILPDSIAFCEFGNNEDRRKNISAIYKFGKFESYTCDIGALYFPYNLRTAFPTDKSNLEALSRNVMYYSGYATILYSTKKPKTLNPVHANENECSLALNLSHEPTKGFMRGSSTITALMDIVGDARENDTPNGVGPQNKWVITTTFSRSTYVDNPTIELAQIPGIHKILKPRYLEPPQYKTECGLHKKAVVWSNPSEHAYNLRYIREILPNIQSLYRMFEGGYKV